MSRVALVTGGAVRVGRALSLGLAEAGYDLLVHYHASSGPAEQVRLEAQALGRDVDLVQADLADPAQVEHLAEHLARRFGRLDLLVNSASLFEPTALLEIGADAWDRVMAVNLRGPHLLVRACADLLRASRGCVVNISDHMALEPWVRYAHHSVSKAALIHLTRIMARALAPHVRVNAIAPGLVLAPEGLDDEALQAEIDATVLGRSGSPEDVLRTVLFLADSPYITGDLIVVDGGRHLT
ncbi:MAG: SDR family oxidoreductase [Gemmatimonadetes bacterium]|nr:MAG: SDR family oxidoreductase [Gemmatimonadota bacterium]